MVKQPPVSLRVPMWQRRLALLVQIAHLASSE